MIQDAALWLFFIGIHLLPILVFVGIASLPILLVIKIIKGIK